MSIASEITRINTNIAAAYSACVNKGAVMPQTQNSANLAATINGIGSVERKDVNFYDYDGTLLYSFTAAQAAELTALPDLPSHPGLTAQGWTHTLSQIQSSVQHNRKADVGAIHTTSDGSTRLYLYVAKGTRIPVLQIWLNMEANTSASIDWGNGTTGTISNTGSSAESVYAEKTDYAVSDHEQILCVKITGGSFKLGRGGVYTVFGNATNDNTQNKNTPILIKAELGSNCTGLMASAFRACSALKTITIPTSVTSLGDRTFLNCYSLTSIAIPSTVTSIDEYTLSNCQCMNALVIPSSITGIGASAIGYCYGLVSVSIPEGITTIGSSAFIASLSLTNVSIPSSVTEIEATAFSNCYHLYEMDLTAFTDSSSIPSLSNTNAFSNTPSYLNFKVANQEMLTAFTTATNWSTFASQFAVG